MSHPCEASARSADSRADPEYALARAQDEYERLRGQAAFLGPTTERLLRAAGLEPGMRVLDAGAGAGDVAFLAAEIVGSAGKVVGVDVDGAALAVARGRAQSLGLRNVTFIEGDARSAELGADFDAAVGRLVLMYWGDPAEALRRIARASGRAAWLSSRSSTWTQPLALGPSRARRCGARRASSSSRPSPAGMQMRMGRHLYGAFLAAGLPMPEMRDEAVTGGGPGFDGYAWLAGVARGLAPLMAKFALADADKLGPETLTDRIRDDTIATGALVWTPSLVGAYARRPER